MHERQWPIRSSTSTSMTNQKPNLILAISVRIKLRSPISSYHWPYKKVVKLVFFSGSWSSGAQIFIIMGIVISTSTGCSTYRGLTKNRPHDCTADRTVGRRRQCARTTARPHRRPHRRPHSNDAEKFSYLLFSYLCLSRVSWEQPHCRLVWEQAI